MDIKNGAFCTRNQLILERNNYKSNGKEMFTEQILWPNTVTDANEHK